MTSGSSSGQRRFLEKYAAAWAARAAIRRRLGTIPDLRIADVLDGIVARMLVELASIPIAPESASPDSAITWRSPVFNLGGRLNPFAGTERQAMLASADACDRIGAVGAASAFRERAAALSDDPPAHLSPASSPPPGRRSAAIWRGPNLPPPEPAPFVAGAQLGMFA